MTTMTRMKGNRGPRGERMPASPFRGSIGQAQVAAETDTAPAPLAIPAERPNRRPRWIIPLIALAAAAFLILGGAAFIATRGDDSTQANSPTLPAGQGAVATETGEATPLPSATARPTETEEPDSTASVRATASPTTVASPTSASATPTAPPVAATATSVPPTAAATPTGRQPYTVVLGDSCDGIRQKFGVPFGNYAAFYAALNALSGKTGANQCNFNPGDRICIPSANDLLNPSALTTDVACLTGQ